MILILTTLPSITANTRHQENISSFKREIQQRLLFSIQGTITSCSWYPFIHFHFSFLPLCSRACLFFLPHQGPLPPPVAQCRCTPLWGESQTCSLASGAAARHLTVKALYLCLWEQLDAAVKHPHQLFLSHHFPFPLFNAWISSVLSEREWE